MNKFWIYLFLQSAVSVAGSLHSKKGYEKNAAQLIPNENRIEQCQKISETNIGEDDRKFLIESCFDQILAKARLGLKSYSSDGKSLAFAWKNIIFFQNGTQKHVISGTQDRLSNIRQIKLLAGANEILVLDRQNALIYEAGVSGNLLPKRGFNTLLFKGVERIAFDEKKDELYFYNPTQSNVFAYPRNTDTLSRSDQKNKAPAKQWDVSSLKILPNSLMTIRHDTQETKIIFISKEQNPQMSVYTIQDQHHLKLEKTKKLNGAESPIAVECLDSSLQVMNPNGAVLEYKWHD